MPEIDPEFKQSSYAIYEHAEGETAGRLERFVRSAPIEYRLQIESGDEVVSVGLTRTELKCLLTATNMVQDD